MVQVRYGAKAIVVDIGSVGAAGYPARERLGVGGPPTVRGPRILIIAVDGATMKYGICRIPPG